MLQALERKKEADKAAKAKSTETRSSEAKEEEKRRSGGQQCSKNGMS